MKIYMDLLQENKIKTLLQFAYCSKKMFFGETNIIKMMNQQVKVLVLSNDISASQEKKYLSKANYYNVKVIHFISKQEMGELFNKNEVACVGINDINMAKEIIKLAQ